MKKHVQVTLPSDTGSFSCSIWTAEDVQKYTHYIAAQQIACGEMQMLSHSTVQIRQLQCQSFSILNQIL